MCERREKKRRETCEKRERDMFDERHVKRDRDMFDERHVRRDGRQKR